MGGSTCNLVVHIGNSIVYNDFLGVGSMHITNDLSMALHTPLSTAEEIKIFYGDLKEPKNDYIEIPVIGDENSTHQVSLEIVYNVIHARVEETLMILAQSVEKSGLKDQIGAGVILTGGSTINTLFARDHLIDEIVVTITPKIFGTGMGIFSEELDLSLKLKSVGKVDDELVILTYQVVAP